MAFVYVGKTETQEEKYCGGSIIDKNWILTAAHCVQGAQGEGLYDKSRIRVVVGTNVIAPAMDPSHWIGRQQILKVADTFVTETSGFVKIGSYAQSSQIFINDIALIQLSSSIRLDMGASVINLVRDDSALKDDEAFTSGWGDTGKNDTEMTSLLEFRFTRVLYDAELCTDLQAVVAEQGLTNEIVCTNTPIGGPCDGDSGGPLFYRRSNTKGMAVPIQVGLLAMTNIGCGTADSEGKTSIWTRISKHCDWIEKTTAIRGLCRDPLTLEL